MLPTRLGHYAQVKPGQTQTSCDCHCAPCGKPSEQCHTGQHRLSSILQQELQNVAQSPSVSMHAKQ